MNEVEKIRGALGNTDFFSGISDANLVFLAEAARIRRLEKQDLLFYEGERGRAFFLLISGCVQLQRTDEEGRETVVRIIRPGEYFAEAVLFEKEEYPVSALALQSSEVIRMPKDAILKLLREENFRNEFIADLLRKQRYLVSQLQQRDVLDAEQRLLLYLRENFPGKDLITPGITKKEMAAAIGTTPETLSRILRRLEKQDILRWSGKEIRMSLPDEN